MNLNNFNTPLTGRRATRQDALYNPNKSMDLSGRENFINIKKIKKASQKVISVKGPGKKTVGEVTYSVPTKWDNNLFQPQVDSPTSWSAAFSKTKPIQYLNMKFPKKYVTSITVQGRKNWDQWVTKGEVFYKDSKNKWVSLGTKQMNGDRNTKVKIPINKTTHELQINVKGWRQHISMRASPNFGSAPSNPAPAQTSVTTAPEPTPEVKSVVTEEPVLDTPTETESSSGGGFCTIL